MTLKRWSYAFLQLSAVLLVVGLAPIIVMSALSPSSPGLVAVLLSLSVAPLGGVCFAAGLLMLVIALIRR